MWITKCGDVMAMMGVKWGEYDYTIIDFSIRPTFSGKAAVDPLI